MPRYLNFFRMWFYIFVHSYLTALIYPHTVIEQFACMDATRLWIDCVASRSGSAQIERNQCTCVKGGRKKSQIFCICVLLAMSMLLRVLRIEMKNHSGQFLESITYLITSVATTRIASKTVAWCNRQLAPSIYVRVFSIYFYHLPTTIKCRRKTTNLPVNKRKKNKLVYLRKSRTFYS